MRAGVAATAFIAIGLGIAVIAGWYFTIPTLLQVFEGSVPAQPNTAIAFVLSGIGILAAQRGARRTTLFCGVAAALLGALTLLEHALSFDVHVNEALLRQPSGTLAAGLGRMAPSTSACFLLTGIAVAIAYSTDSSRIRPAITALLGSVIFGISAVAIAGYVTGVTGTYAWGNLGSMAWLTALGFMVLGAGIIALGWSNVQAGKRVHHSGFPCLSAYPA